MKQNYPYETNRSAEVQRLTLKNKTTSDFLLPKPHLLQHIKHQYYTMLNTHSGFYYYTK